ncbi:hypothetical protein [Spirosoma pomorum]
MNTAQNYAVATSHASTPELTAQVQTLPLVSTGPLYSQIDTLRDVYLLCKNPDFVEGHSRLLMQSIKELVRALDNAIDNLDPLILEAISSRSLNT